MARRRPNQDVGLTLTFGVEPLVGWRVWTTGVWTFRDGRTEAVLGALNGCTPNNGLWLPLRPTEARCRSYLHDAPDAGCQCGLWAVRTKEQAIGQQPINDNHVYGEVYMWGRVCEFRKGFRAQYAYPKSLYTTGHTQKDFSHYGVPVHAPDHWQVNCNSCGEGLYRLARPVLGPISQLAADDFRPVSETIEAPKVGEDIKCPLCGACGPDPSGWMGIQAVYVG